MHDLKKNELVKNENHLSQTKGKPHVCLQMLLLLLIEAQLSEL